MFDRPNEVGKNLYVPPKTMVNATIRHSAKPQEALATAEAWHRRFAHINHQSLNKLEEMVDGIKIVKDGGGTVEAGSPCETCKLARAPRQISRRPIGRSFGRFGRVRFDLIQVQTGFNRHKWISHFYVEGVRFH